MDSLKVQVYRLSEFFKTPLVNLAAIGLILVIFVFRMFELAPVGETWDEVPKVRNGQIHINSLRKMDFSYETWVAHKEHPPLGKVLLAFPTYLSSKLELNPFNDDIYSQGKRYFWARAASLVFSALTLYLVFLIGKRMFNGRVGVLALILLALYPHFAAHSFIATLESPQAFFTTLLVFTLIYYKDTIFTVRSALVVGTVLGLCGLVKLSSGFIAPLPFIMSVWALSGKGRKRIKDFFLFNLTVYGIAGLVFFMGWPWLWFDTFNRLNETLLYFSTSRLIYFWGALVEPPYYYYLYYFVISTPIIYFLLFVPSLARKGTNFKVWFLLIWFLLPFLASFSGFKQNGVRYLYMAFPAFALLCAVGFDWFSRAIQHRGLRALCLVSVITVVLFANFFISPYYLNYYNFLVGGPNGAYAGRLAQVGWWGEGSREMAAYVNRNVPAGARLGIKSVPRHVFPVFREDLSVEHDRNKEYLIINVLYKWTHQDVPTKDYETIYQVTAGGTPIMELYKKQD